MTNQIRIIKASNESGSYESVYFTEDFDSPPEDFFIMEDDMSIDTDETIDDNLPSCFPKEYELIRRD